MTQTFGFEAEFANDVTELARTLNRLDRTWTGDVHNYMCDCEGCEYCGDDPYDFRVKRDSSCGGEVISRILSTAEWDTARELMADLQQAAFDTDSVPGLSAGFHVHVGRPHRRSVRGKLLYTFMLWEEVLCDLAGGRWPSNRGWNASLVNMAAPTLRAWLMTYQDYTSMQCRALTSSELLRAINLDSDSDVEFFEDLADHSMDWDRHATLATSGRHPTVEFRLFNSTRVAWRMELWCRLATTLAEPVFLDALLAKHREKHGNVTTPDLLDVVAGYGDDTLAELVDRQHNYQCHVDAGTLVIAEAVA